MWLGRARTLGGEAMWLGRARTLGGEAMRLARTRAFGGKAGPNRDRASGERGR